MRKTLTEAAPAPVHTIAPLAVYFADDLRRFLRFGRDTLRREREAGRLRVAWRAGRLYVLGEWLLDWIRAGEVGAPGEER